MKVDGKVALVTGGASGIGKALCLRLLESGAKLVVVLDFDQEGGITAESEFSAKFGEDRVKFIHCDVTNEEKLKSSFQEAFDVHNALDIVVNNAGIASKDPMKTLQVNLIAVMNGVLFAEELMTKEPRSEKGVIINTASMAGLIISPTTTFSYTAAKHGVVGLTKSLPICKKGFSDNLRTAAICPGLVMTPLILSNQDAFDIDEEQMAKYVEYYYKSHITPMPLVIDAFMMAISNEDINGGIIKVNPPGIELVKS